MNENGNGPRSNKLSQEHPVRLFWREWILAKIGYDPEQNEDACLASEFNDEDGAAASLIAISDGASETVYSRQWSRSLVEAAEPNWPALSAGELNQRLDEVRQGFSPTESESLTPFTRIFVRDKFLSQGSQATLLVLTVTGSKNTDALTLRALSIGDSCLLLFRENGEVCPFPVRTSDDFGLEPGLVQSRAQEQLDCRRWDGKMEPGDVLLVCTDAVGKWALQCLESNPSRADLVFEFLLGLLVPVASESTALDQEASSTNPSPPSEKVSDEVSPSENSNEEGNSLSRFLRRLMQRFRLEDPLIPDQPPGQLEATAEGVIGSTALVAHDATADNDQQEAEPVIDQRLNFEQFIERYRAPESRPRMRDDDSTLLVCLPVLNAGDDDECEALQIIRKHQMTAEQRPPVLRPADDHI